MWAIVSSVCVFIFFALFLTVPHSLEFATISAALAFLLWMCIFSIGRSNNPKTRALTCRGKEVALITVFSLSFLVTTSPTRATGLYLGWLQIPIQSYVSFGGAIVLLLFLPGYIILSWLNAELPSIVGGVIAMLLSLFVISLLGFGTVLVTGSVGHLAKYIILVIDVVFFSSYLALTRIRTKTRYVAVRVLSTENSLIPSLTVLVTLASTAALAYLVQFNNSPSLIWLDMWREFGIATQISKTGLPHVNPTTGLLYPGYPYWFHLFLASFFESSSLPPINSYVMLAFLIVLPQVAFWKMSEEISKSPRAAAVSTLFYCCFSGFGWIYPFLTGKAGQLDYDTLVLTSQKTFDVAVGIGYLSDSITARLVGEAALFVLIWILLEERSKRRFSRDTIVVVLVGLAVLAHIIEAIVFAVLVITAVLLKERTCLPDLRRISICGIVGVLIVVVVDLCAPGRVYTAFFGQALLASALFFVSAFVISFVRERSVLAFRLHGCPTARTLVVYTLPLLFFFLFGLVVWNEQRDLFIAWDIYEPGKVLPWFVYPLRFGVVGLLALSSAALPGVWKDTRLRFVMAWGFLTTLFASAMPYLQSLGISVWQSWRLHLYVFGSACVLGGLALMRQAAGLRKRCRGRIVGALLVVLVIITGLPSFFLALETRMMQTGFNRYSLLPDEVHAVQTIDLSLGAAAAPSQRSWEVLTTFIGQPSIGGYEAWYYPLLFRTPQPELAFRILHEFNVRYLYLTASDRELQPTGAYISRLIRYLPPAFNTSQVSVYRVPTYVPPMDSGTAFVVQDSWPIVNEEDLFTIEMAAMSQIQYDIVKHSDLSQFSKSCIVISDCTDRRQGEDLLAWVKRGGTLLVIDRENLDSGFWSNYMGLSLDKAVLVDGARGKEGTRGLQPFLLPIARAKSSARPVAWFVSNDSPVTPFVFQEKVGDGQLSYARFSAYYHAMKSAPSPLREEIYSSMPSLLGLLDLRSRPAIASVGRMFWSAIFQGKISLRNDVQILSESAWIPGLEWLRVDAMRIEGSSRCSVGGLTPTLPILEHNVTLRFRQIQGGFKSMIETPRAEVLKGSGSYSVIAIASPFNWTLTPDDDSGLLIEKADGKLVNVQGGRVMLKVSQVYQSLEWYCPELLNAVIEGKNNSLICKGLAKIQGAYISYPYSPLLRNQPLLTQGISFRILDSEENTFLVSDYAHGIVYPKLNGGILRNLHLGTGHLYLSILIVLTCVSIWISLLKCKRTIKSPVKQERNSN